MRSPLSPWLLRCGAVAITTAFAGFTAQAGGATVPVADLVRQLGAEDYATREMATTELAALGPAAADALLAAAESSDDVEVALRARWLVDALPLAQATDPPDVSMLLDRYTRGDEDERVRIMHRLLRLDGDAGIEALARIVRLERSPSGSRIAAALLVREWAPDDPVWPSIASRIAQGLGPSRRPSARFLRAVASASPDAPLDARTATIDEARAAFPLIARAVTDDATPEADEEAEPHGDEQTRRIFRRALIDLLQAQGRRDEALVEAGQLLAACRGSVSEEELLAAELAWLTDHGLPEAAALVSDRLAPGRDRFAPLVAFAAAVAAEHRGDHAAAASHADAAHDALVGGDVELSRRLQAAMLLARWGATDWSLREYRATTDDPNAPFGEVALASILASELLHELGRDDEAADVLERMLDGRHDEDAAQTLLRMERDPRAIRSRMLSFKAFAAGARGDADEERRLIGEAVGIYPKDVDALIRLHRLAAGNPSALADARDRIARAIEQIEEEIQAVPDDPTGYNEYAWLVANTEGDVRKALRYSKRSLELSFDTSSYLDTLAHCRAANGDGIEAVRTQRLAVRQEPHNVALRQNLARFEKALETP